MLSLESLTRHGCLFSIADHTVCVLYTWLGYQVYVMFVLCWIYTYHETLCYLGDLINRTLIKVAGYYNYLLFGLSILNKSMQILK